jgi:sterol desaturase/sphingolipid hydroxylase (fatty acid hydroxylase superfamily)
MKKWFKSLDRIDQLSVPLFIVTMLTESILLRRRTLRTLTPAAVDETTVDDPQTLHQLPVDRVIPLGYERKDTTASLLMLVGNIVFALVTESMLGRLDGFLFKRRLSNIGRRRGSLALAMVLWDFLYYWDHRFMHEVRLFWANHVNHHSGRRYNLSTALRQPWSGLMMAWVFAPMPLLGFPGKKTFRAGQLNLLYQYWIHTEAIDRLPAKAEAILNTPSHHRVHHGANKQYLDKNYGGILIIWDKLFGTFEPEIRQVRYGLTKNISTYNPFRIAYHEFAAIARDIKGADRLRDKVSYVVRHPGWAPSGSQPQPLQLVTSP